MLRLEEKVDRGMSEGNLENIQRWITKRKMALVLSIVKSERSVAEAEHKHGLTVAELEGWKERALLGADNSLRARPKHDEALKDEKIKKLKQKIGELVIDIDILKEAQKPYLPTTPGTSDECSKCFPAT
jgi:hypothetical protein